MIVASLLVMPSAQAQVSGSASIILTGSRTGYVDLTFTGPVTLDEFRAKFEYSGTYSGWFIHKLGEAVDTAGDEAGSAAIRSLVPAGDPPTSPSFEFAFGFNPELSAGSYRLYLLSDGPSTVTIPVEGISKDIRFRPRARTFSFAETIDFPPAGPGGTYVRAQTRIPIVLDPSFMVTTMALAYADPGAQVISIGTCVVVGEDECDGGPAGGGVLVSTSPTYDFTLVAVRHYAVGSFSRGGYSAWGGLTTAGSVHSGKSGVFILKIVPD